MGFKLLQIYLQICMKCILILYAFGRSVPEKELIFKSERDVNVHKTIIPMLNYSRNKTSAKIYLKEKLQRKSFNNTSNSKSRRKDKIKKKFFTGPIKDVYVFSKFKNRCLNNLNAFQTHINRKLVILNPRKLNNIKIVAIPRHNGKIYENNAKRSKSRYNPDKSYNSVIHLFPTHTRQLHKKYPNQVKLVENVLRSNIIKSNPFYKQISDNYEISRQGQKLKLKQASSSNLFHISIIKRKPLSNIFVLIWNPKNYSVSKRNQLFRGFFRRVFWPILIPRPRPKVVPNRQKFVIHKIINFHKNTKKPVFNFLKKYSSNLDAPVRRFKRSYRGGRRLEEEDLLEEALNDASYISHSKRRENPYQRDESQKRQNQNNAPYYTQSKERDSAYQMNDQQRHQSQNNVPFYLQQKQRDSSYQREDQREHSTFLEREEILPEPQRPDVPDLRKILNDRESVEKLKKLMENSNLSGGRSRDIYGKPKASADLESIFDAMRELSKKDNKRRSKRSPVFRGIFNKNNLIKETIKKVSKKDSKPRLKRNRNDRNGVYNANSIKKALKKLMKKDTKQRSKRRAGIRGRLDEDNLINEALKDASLLSRSKERLDQLQRGTQRGRSKLLESEDNLPAGHRYPLHNAPFTDLKKMLGDAGSVEKLKKLMKNPDLGLSRSHDWDSKPKPAPELENIFDVLKEMSKKGRKPIESHVKEPHHSILSAERFDNLPDPLNVKGDKRKPIVSSSKIGRITLPRGFGHADERTKKIENKMKDDRNKFEQLVSEFSRTMKPSGYSNEHHLENKHKVKAVTENKGKKLKEALRKDNKAKNKQKEKLNEEKLNKMIEEKIKPYKYEDTRKEDKFMIETLIDGDSKHIKSNEMNNILRKKVNPHDGVKMVKEMKTIAPETARNLVKERINEKHKPEEPKTVLHDEVINKYKNEGQEEILHNVVEEMTRISETAEDPRNETIYTIRDAGKDNVVINATSTPEEKLHGRRSIIIAGCVVIGLGLLITISGVCAMYIRSRYSRGPFNTNNSKSYQRLGTNLERARLRKYQTLTLSSDDEDDGYDVNANNDNSMDTSSDDSDDDGDESTDSFLELDSPVRSGHL